MDYVTLVEQYVVSKVSSQQRGYIFVDSPECACKPPLIGSYRPDLFFCHDNKLIIGEAKTVGDYDRLHSKDQYVTYLKECQNFKGESILILCSSWTISLSYKTLIKYLKRQNGFDTKVIIISELKSTEIYV